MRRTMLAGGFLLLLASITTFYGFTSAYLDHATGGDPIEVVVATTNIPIGRPMREDWLGARTIPRRYLDERHIAASDRGLLVGAVLSQSVNAGEAVLITDLNSEVGGQRSLAGAIAPGRRAYAIGATSDATFSGMLKPGDRVDVMLEEGRATRVIMENILVLAVGAAMQSSDIERTRNVSLLLTGEEAAALALTREDGEYDGIPFTFLLRPFGDDRTGGHRPVAIDDILRADNRERLGYTGDRFLLGAETSDAVVPEEDSSSTQAVPD